MVPCDFFGWEARIGACKEPLCKVRMLLEALTVMVVVAAVMVMTAALHGVELVDISV